MSRHLAIMAGLLVLAGCGDRLSPDERAARDARDVARVEAAQDIAPPISILAPAAITSADFAAHGLGMAGCGFRADGGGSEPIAWAMADQAVIKLGGELRIYASDKGSESLSPAAWSQYEGRQHVIDLQAVGGLTAKADAESMSHGPGADRPGHLTIRDPYDRVVFSANGRIRCAP